MNNRVLTRAYTHPAGPGRYRWCPWCPQQRQHYLWFPEEGERWGRKRGVSQKQFASTCDELMRTSENTWKNYTGSGSVCLEEINHQENENSFIIYSPSCHFKPVCISFFWETQKDIFGRISKLFQFPLTWNQNCLVVNILQNIFFCVQQRVSKVWQNFHFWVNCPLNLLSVFKQMKNISKLILRNAPNFSAFLF